MGNEYQCTKSYCVLIKIIAYCSNLRVSTILLLKNSSNDLSGFWSVCLSSSVLALYCYHLLKLSALCISQVSLPLLFAFKHHSLVSIKMCQWSCSLTAPANYHSEFKLYVPTDWFTSNVFVSIMYSIISFKKVTLIRGRVAKSEYINRAMAWGGPPTKKLTDARIKVENKFLRRHLIPMWIFPVKVKTETIIQYISCLFSHSSEWFTCTGLCRRPTKLNSGWTI